MASYTRDRIKIDKILLDVENPRFASYFERLGKSQPSQGDIMLYLLQNASVSTLAENIRLAGGLHPAESIVCIKQNNEYVVLEGNRRVATCKALYKIYHDKCNDWIPKDVFPVIPLLDTDSDKELVEGISILDAVIYETREQAQPYISDKHIDGVKKWESIEKSSYYYKMFMSKLTESQYSDIKADVIISEIAKNTITQKSDVRECVIKYGFFMSVYNSLLGEYSADKLTETNSYLPLVDRFMGTIVERSDLGLGLPLSEYLCYVAHRGKEELLTSVLFLIGEAFIARKITDGELPPITSTEVDSKRKQKKLIRDNERIPGLHSALYKYKASPSEEEDRGNNEKASSKKHEDDPVDATQPENNSSSEEQSGSTEQTAEVPYEPKIPWVPRQPQIRSLYFSKGEGESFKLTDDNDTDIKIKFVIAELSRLIINNHPYSCVSLYRVLLEAATKKAYIEKEPRENKAIINFDKKNLQAAVSKLAKHNVLKMSEQDRANVVEYVDKKHIIKTLNNYMHNPKLVDSETILTSWITLKEYIKACLT